MSVQWQVVEILMSVGLVSWLLGLGFSVMLLTFASFNRAVGVASDFAS